MTPATTAARGATLSSTPTLTIDDGIGNRVTIIAGDQLTVGRKADFVIGDDDRYLHRRLLTFHYDGTWLVTNVGRALSVTMQPVGPGYYSVTTLGPGAMSPLPRARTALVVATVERTYELTVEVTDGPLPAPLEDLSELTSDPTVDVYEPTAEHLQLMRALAAPLLKYPGAGYYDIPTVKDLMRELGWSEKKVNTKINYICTQLLKSGIPDFQARNGNAISRRLILARYAAERISNDPYWAGR